MAPIAFAISHPLPVRSSLRHRRHAFRLTCSASPTQTTTEAEKYVLVEHCSRRRVRAQSSHDDRLYVIDPSKGSWDVFEDPGPGEAKDAKLDNPAGHGPQKGVSRGAIDTSNDPEWLTYPGAGLFRRLMLPEAWPDGVSNGYLSFAIWNMLRNAFRKANYVVGTSILLFSLGLSSKNAMSLSVALNWILKDGLGLMSKVAVASQVSRVIDRDPKAWRMAGDTLMILCVLVELMSPLRPSAFFIFGSLSSLLMAVADAMSGPSYRVFLQNFAIADNVGDVSSRAEIHAVIGLLLGLAVGAGSSTLVTGDSSTIFDFDHALTLVALFCTFSTGHLFSCWREVAVVELPTLNWKRLSLILDHFLVENEVPSIPDVNHREKLANNPLVRPKVVFGESLRDFVDSPRDVSLAYEDRSERYFIVRGKDGRLGVMLEEEAETRDMLKAALQAWCMLETSVDGQPGDSRAARKRADALFPAFEAGLKSAGWTPRLLFKIGTTRYTEGSSSFAPKVLQTVKETSLGR